MGSSVGGSGVLVGGGCGVFVGGAGVFGGGCGVFDGGGAFVARGVFVRRGGPPLDDAVSVGVAEGVSVG